MWFALVGQRLWWEIFNTHPGVVPCLAKGISGGRLVDLALAYSVGSGVEPDMICRIDLDERACSSRDSCRCLSIAAVGFWRMGVSLLTSLLFLSSMFVGGPPKFLAPGRPARLACLLFAAKVVQGVWDVYREELEAVPPDLVPALWSAFHRSCVDEFWSVWSVGAEAGLLWAYQRAGSPVSCRGNLQIRRRRLMGRAAGGRGSSKLYRDSHGDDVDVTRTRTRSKAKHQPPATAHQQQPSPPHPSPQIHKRQGNEQEAHWH